jgi:hypothetical protein
MAYEKFEKVIRNVDKLLANPDVKPAEINQYLNQEGYTASRFKSAAENYAKAKGATSTYGNIEAGIQGLTFGFGDEFEAVIKTLKNKKPYEQNLAAVQFAKQEFEAESPYQAMASEVAGSLPVAFAAGKTAVQAAGKIPQVANLLSKIPSSFSTVASTSGAGAIGGGLTGAGTAQEGERAMGAQKGAVQGAILAPVVLAGMKAGGATTKAVAEKLGIPDLAKTIVDATKDIPIVKNITGKTADFFGMSGDAMQRKADTKIIQALQRDGFTLPQIKGVMDEIRASGYKPETIMEFGGKATKQLGETVASYPGARVIAENLAEERKSGAGNRILTDFQKAFQVDADPMEIANNVIKLRQSSSAPLYKAAYEKDALIGGESIDKLMQDSAFKRAYDRADRLAQREVDEAGNIVGMKLPDLKESGNVFDLKTIDRIKRGIDAEINYSKLPTSGLEKTEVDSIKNLRSVFMKTVDEQAPTEYKQARQAFAGQSEILDAIENGKNFFDIDARQLKQIYNKLSPSEKDGFSVGAYDAIRTKIQTGADGVDMVRRTFGSTEKRDQIKELIGADAFDTLNKQLTREKAIRSTDIQITGGSPTQRRTEAAKEFEGSTELVPQMAEKGLVKGGMDYLLRSVTGPGGRTAETIAPDLYSVDPARQAQIVDRLKLLDEYLRNQALQQQVGAGVVAPSLLE